MGPNVCECLRFVSRYGLGPGSKYLMRPATGRGGVSGSRGRLRGPVGLALGRVDGDAHGTDDRELHIAPCDVGLWDCGLCGWTEHTSAPSTALTANELSEASRSPRSGVGLGLGMLSLVVTVGVFARGHQRHARNWRRSRWRRGRGGSLRRHPAQFGVYHASNLLCAVTWAVKPWSVVRRSTRKSTAPA